VIKESSERPAHFPLRLLNARPNTVRTPREANLFFSRACTAQLSTLELWGCRFAPPVVYVVSVPGQLQLETSTYSVRILGDILFSSCSPSKKRSYFSFKATGFFRHGEEKAAMLTTVTIKRRMDPAMTYSTWPTTSFSPQVGIVRLSPRTQNVLPVTNKTCGEQACLLNAYRFPLTSALPFQAFQKKFSDHPPVAVQLESPKRRPMHFRHSQKGSCRLRNL